jgi:VCBS repeat-containing protein
MMRLEQRIMFDGAVADTTAEVINDVPELELVSEPQVDEPVEAESTETQSTRSQSTSSSSLLNIVAPLTQFNKIDSARELVVDHLNQWFESSDYLVQAQLIFSADAGSSSWQNNALSLRQDVISGDYTIRVEVRSDNELDGLQGAYSPEGTAGEATIYLNQNWLSSATIEAVEAVLLEEIGHDFDSRLNEGLDTQGDEGHAFAGLLLHGETNYASAIADTDQQTIVIDGQSLLVEGAAPYNIVQVTYVPMEEADIETALNTISGSASTTITTTIAIGVSGSGTVVVYDHWEDGYEIDLSNPLQATTLIWGDGDLTNGVAPGTADDLILVDQPLIIQNDVVLASPQPTDFDAKDRIASTGPISLTRAGWGSANSTSLAGGVNLIDSANGGTNYVIPIGESLLIDGSITIFQYTSAHLIAYQDGTSVDIDLDADGGVDTTITLNQGETYFVDGGLEAGATITADQDIGVYLLAGNSSTENRWFTVAPVEQWSDSYYAPVVQTSTTRVFVFLYNPGATPIDVTYESIDGSGLVSTTVTLAANSSEYVEMARSAGHFYTQTGESFSALGVVDSSLNSDWSYTLNATNSLTSELIVPWGPGSPSLATNENPAWITATGDTELYIDSATAEVYSIDSAGVSSAVVGVMMAPDTYRYSIDRLQSYRVFDTSDNDQSGLRIYTVDGVSLSAAWGADASRGSSFDIGTSISPFPTYSIYKSVKESFPGVSDGDGLIELGEQIEYSLTVENGLLTDLFNINITDTLPTSGMVTYVPSSTVLTVYDTDGSVLVTNSIADVASDLPLLGAGYTIADTNPSLIGSQGIANGQTITITYRAQVSDVVNQAMADANFNISSSAGLGGNELDGSPISSKAASAVFTLSLSSDPEVIVLDTNDTAAGDESVPEDTFLVGRSFSLLPLGNVAQLTFDGTTVISVADLTNTVTNPISIATTEGQLIITGFNVATGEVTYTYHPTGSFRDHSAGDIVDSINIEVTDGLAGTASNNLDIFITPVPIVIIDDNNAALTGEESVLENQVLTSKSFVVRPLGDVVRLTFDGTTDVTVAQLLTANITPVVVATGKGELTITNFDAVTGTVTYDYDPTGTEWDHSSGEVIDSINIEVTDGSNATANSTLDVLIGGAVRIIIDDNNTPFTGDESVVEDSSILNRTFRVLPLGDVAQLLFNSTTVVSAAQLATANTAAVGVITTEGTLTITDFNAATGTVSYNYELTSGGRDHSLGELVETINIQVTDGGGATANDDLDILITDTSPTALDDSETMLESAVIHMGNVITSTAGADIASSDIPMTVVGLAAGDTNTEVSDVATLATDIAGEFGQLSINSSGNYEYTLDVAAYEVRTLGEGSSLRDYFTYTIEDADGSMSHALVVIYVEGEANYPAIYVDVIEDPASNAEPSNQADGSLAADGVYAAQLEPFVNPVGTISTNPATTTEANQLSRQTSVTGIEDARDFSEVARDDVGGLAREFIADHEIEMEQAGQSNSSEQPIFSTTIDYDRTVTDSANPITENMAVTPDFSHELSLQNKIPHQYFSNGSSFDYVIPVDTFRHTDVQAEIGFYAVMVDGSPLPKWLELDEKGKFSGTPPLDYQGELLIKVVARDDAGRQVDTLVRIKVGDAAMQDTAVPEQGKTSLSEQLKTQNIAN